MNKKYIGIGAGLIGLLIGGYFLVFPKEVSVSVVSEHKVTRGDISNTTLVFGKAAPEEVYELSFDVSGKLIEYNFDEGEQIKKGATIAKIDSRTVRSQISRANSAVAIERSRYTDLVAPVSTQDQDTKQAEIETQTLVTEGNRVEFGNNLENVLDDYRDLLDKKIDTFYLYPTRSDALIRLKEAKKMSDEDRVILSKVRVSLERLYKETELMSDVQTKYILVRGLFDSTSELGGDISRQLENESTVNARQIQDNLEDLQEDMDALYDSLNSSFVTLNTSITQLSVLEKQLVSLQAGADRTALGLQQSVINAKRSDLNALYTDLAKLTLKAPISGVVFDAPLINYQTVSSGQVVLSVVPDEPLVVKAQVAESDVQFIGPGNKVEISFDALVDQVFTGSISEVKNRENTNSAVPTYETTFVFDEGKNLDAIRSGMTANITVASGNRSNVLYIPVGYLQNNSNGSFVTLQNSDGTFMEQIVGVGVRTTAGLTEITSGLSENQTVYLVK